VTAMAEITIILILPAVQAEALAQLAKRFGWDHADSLSRQFDGGVERDAMLAGVLTLQRALAEAGFAPR